MKYQPMNTRLVVRREVSDETTAGGIVLPDTAREKPLVGYVEAVGPGYLRKGKRIPLALAPGDRVYFKRYAGVPLHLEGDDTEYLILEIEDIHAKVVGSTEGLTASPKRRWRSQGGGEESPATYSFD